MPIRYVKAYIDLRAEWYEVVCDGFHDEYQRKLTLIFQKTNHEGGGNYLPIYEDEIIKRYYE